MAIFRAPEAESTLGSPWATPVKAGQKGWERTSLQRRRADGGWAGAGGGRDPWQRSLQGSLGCLEHWRQETSSLQSHGRDVILVIGEPGRP